MKLRIQPISGAFLVLRCRKLGARLALQDPKDDEIRLPAKAERLLSLVGLLRGDVRQRHTRLKSDTVEDSSERQ